LVLFYSIKFIGLGLAIYDCLSIEVLNLGTGGFLSILGDLKEEAGFTVYKGSLVGILEPISRRDSILVCLTVPFTPFGWDGWIGTDGAGCFTVATARGDP
jgi:hypothetical protein